MSRSYRKHAFFSSNSKRWGKQHASRVLRHRVKQILHLVDPKDQNPREYDDTTEFKFLCGEDFLMPKADELYDFWWDNDSGCSFDPKKFPYLLRK